MTHFEYLFVAVSIILSFTLLRLLDALPLALGRARGYWVHAAWVVVLLYLCAAFWWLSWFNRKLDELSFHYFLFLLASPSILYLTATALVSPSPASVSCWHQHFYRNRRRFFVGAFVYLSMLVANSFVTFQVPLQHPLRLGQAFLLGLFAAGALLRSERAQSILGGLASAFLLWSLIRVLSGSLPMSFD